MGGDKPAAGAIAEAKTKAKSKASTSRKSRAKIPAVSADGNPVAAKPKAAPKPRGKAAAKKEVESEGNAIEAEEPPTKKRKTSGAKAGKKVIETVADVKDEEAESDSAGSANSAEAMKVDGQSGEGESDTMIMEEYDAPEGEGEQVQMVEATKVEIEEEIAGKTVVETLQAEAQIVIQQVSYPRKRKGKKLTVTQDFRLNAYLSIIYLFSLVSMPEGAI